jgi:hypothetical protein
MLLCRRLINLQLRNDSDGKLQKVSERCLILSSDHYVHKNNLQTIDKRALTKIRSDTFWCIHFVSMVFENTTLYDLSMEHRNKVT